MRKSFCLVPAAVVALLTMSSTAHADGPSDKIDKRVCIAAAERGQELREAKQMRDARAQFALCSRTECPESVRKECTRWNAEAEAALASVKLEAVDAAGKGVPAVKVTIDGAPVGDEVPNDPVILDPGSHEVRFEKAGDSPVVKTLTLAMGDRGVVVRAVFAATVAPKPAVVTPVAPGPAKDGGSLVLPIALGGLGVAAIGSATVFWLLGNSDLDDVKARCKSGCPSSESDGARTKHLVGDIALGVGIVALGAAAYFLITREKPQNAAELFVHRF